MLEKRLLGGINPHLLVAASISWETGTKDTIVYGGYFLMELTKMMRQNTDAHISEAFFNTCMNEQASDSPHFKRSLREYMGREDPNNIMIGSDLLEFLQGSFQNMIGKCCPKIWKKIEEEKESILSLRNKVRASGGNIIQNNLH